MHNKGPRSLQLLELAYGITGNKKVRTTQIGYAHIWPSLNKTLTRIKNSITTVVVNVVQNYTSGRQHGVINVCISEEAILGSSQFIGFTGTADRLRVLTGTDCKLPISQKIVMINANGSHGGNGIDIRDAIVF